MKKVTNATRKTLEIPLLRPRGRLRHNQTVQVMLRAGESIVVKDEEISDLVERAARKGKLVIVDEPTDAKHEVDIAEPAVEALEIEVSASDSISVSDSVDVRDTVEGEEIETSVEPYFAREHSDE